MRVLVCDDEETIRWSLQEHLKSEGYDVDLAEDGAEAIASIEASVPDAVVLDLRMPNVDGLTALGKIREQGHTDLPVIVITAHGAVDSAIEATRLGAAGYLQKPFDLRAVSLELRRALDTARLEREVHWLRDRQESSGYGKLIGRSRAMLEVFDTLGRLEDVDAPTVLITGESGTGKDLVAQAIHSQGARREKPFMEIDCASLPEHLIESALFGHEKGAFTDAHTQKRGLFEVARGGVIFLDEIGEMHAGTQAKLLRALENRRFKRVGGTVDLPLDAAVIAATNRDLKDEVKAGRFREDLYYRLHVIPIALPALRQRPEDIEALVDHLLEKTAGKRRPTGVSRKALDAMKRYTWPGNVRELRNIVERIVILHADVEVIGFEHLPAELRNARSGVAADDECPFTLPEDGVNLDGVERGLLIQALDRTGGNQSAAARLLGITRYALRYRMEKHGIMRRSAG